MFPQLAGLGRSATAQQCAIGEVDAIKLRSSMTLFATAAPDEPVFGDVLDQCFAGEKDSATLSLL